MPPSRRRLHARRAADPGRELLPLPRPRPGAARGRAAARPVRSRRRRRPRRRGRDRPPASRTRASWSPASPATTPTCACRRPTRARRSRRSRSKRCGGGSPRAPSTSSIGRSSRRAARRAAGERRARGSAIRSTPSCSRGSSRKACSPSPPADAAHAAAPPVARPHRPAADARGGRRVRSRRRRRRLRSSAVERLLASPHFGERWGRLWLDAARYADSDGFEKDKPRFVWMYRDWVIDALNDDMPYDQFIVEQIAGDLLPEPTQDQRVATGFLRNSMINEEGGIDPEQFRMEAMFDRMDAIGKAMLGLTDPVRPVPHAQVRPARRTPTTTGCSRSSTTATRRRSRRTPTTSRAEWQATDARHPPASKTTSSADNPDWRERMAAWEASVRDDQPEWTVVRPEARRHRRPEALRARRRLDPRRRATRRRCTPPSSPSTSTRPKITAVRLGAAQRPEPAARRAGPVDLRHVSRSPSSRSTPRRSISPSKQTELKFAEATADVNPPERELGQDLRRPQRQAGASPGPIEYAIDGDDLTAWTHRHRPRPQQRAAQGRVRAREAARSRRPACGSRSSSRRSTAAGTATTIRTTTSAGSASRSPRPRSRWPTRCPADVRAILDDSRRRAHARASRPRLQLLADDRRPSGPEANRRIEALWQSHPRGTTQLVLHGARRRRAKRTGSTAATSSRRPRK